MKRITLLVVTGCVVSLLNTSPSAAFTYTWNLANPSQLAAYQIGKGVITVASAPQNACGPTELVADVKPFVYDYKVGSTKGVLCLASYVAPIAAYYQTGSPSSITVRTKAGAVTVPVVPAPPASPAISHLPFH